MRISSRYRTTPMVIAAISIGVLGGCGTREPVSEHETHPHGPPPRFADRMDEIARRLERLGRAGLAGRWELARYEVEELGETFEDVERTPLPEDVAELNVKEFIEPLVGTALPALDSALVRQDPAAFRDAFAGVAKRCNNCHRAAGRTFVEIPGEPGVDIPALTPLPARP